MTFSTKTHKITGITEILFGLLLVIICFSGGCEQVVYKEYKCFLVSYWKVIFYFNGGALFIILGILTYKGLLAPYFMANSFEKAKVYIISTITVIPILFSISFSIFTVANEHHFDIIFIILLILWVFILFVILYLFWKNMKLVKA